MDFSLCDGDFTAIIALIPFLFGGLFVIGSSWATIRAARSFLNPGGAAARLMLWKSSRRWKSVPRASFGGALSEGAVLRLRGLVEAREVRPTYLSPIASVAHAYSIGERGGGTISSGRGGLDFDLRLADGTLVAIPAREASERGSLQLLDGRPHRWSDSSRRAWFCESRVLPGDEIEVVGRLRRVVDPSASRLGDRAPALRWTLLPADSELPILLGTTCPSADERTPPNKSLQADEHLGRFAPSVARH